jgi:hypothetical protein
MNFVWMNVDQNLFKDDSRSNAVPMTEVVARGEVFDGGHKIKSVKIVSTSKGKQKVINM